MIFLSIVMIPAIKKLLESHSEWVVPYLRNLLKTTENHRIRNEVALALLDFKDKRAIPVIAQLLVAPKTINHRGTLIYVLSEFSPYIGDYLPLLVDLVVTGGFEVSRQAFIAIEEIEGEIDEDIWLQCKQKITEGMKNSSGDKAEILRDLYELFEDEEE